METDQAPRRLRTLPSWLLARSAIAARRAVAAELSDLDAGRSQYALLACLDEFAPLSQAELGARAGLDRGDVVRFVDELAAAGLAVRTVDPGDRRRNLITLTDEGRRRLVALDAAVTRAQARIMAPLTPEEQTHLVSLLGKLLEP